MINAKLKIKRGEIALNLYFLIAMKRHAFGGHFVRIKSDKRKTQNKKRENFQEEKPFIAMKCIFSGEIRGNVEC